MFGKIFVSPQVKQIVIINNKYGINMVYTSCLMSCRKTEDIEP